VADHAGNLLNVCPLHDPAGGVMGRVQDDQFRAIGNEGGEFVDIKGEIAILAQLDGDRLATYVVDHRVINREAGVGINNLISFINQSQHREENDRFASGHDYYFFGGNFHTAGAANVVGNGLAQFGEARRGTVVGPALVQRIHGSFHDIGGSVE